MKALAFARRFPGVALAVYAWPWVVACARYVPVLVVLGLAWWAAVVEGVAAVLARHEATRAWGVPAEADWWLGAWLLAWALAFAVLYRLVTATAPWRVLVAAWAASVVTAVAAGLAGGAAWVQWEANWFHPGVAAQVASAWRAGEPFPWSAPGIVCAAAVAWLMMLLAFVRDGRAATRFVTLGVRRVALLAWRLAPLAGLVGVVWWWRGPSAVETRAGIVDAVARVRAGLPGTVETMAADLPAWVGVIAGACLMWVVLEGASAVSGWFGRLAERGAQRLHRVRIAGEAGGVGASLARWKARSDAAHARAQEVIEAKQRMLQLELEAVARDQAWLTAALEAEGGEATATAQTAAPHGEATAGAQIEGGAGATAAATPAAGGGSGEAAGGDEEVPIELEDEPAGTAPDGPPAAAAGVGSETPFEGEVDAADDVDAPPVDPVDVLIRAREARLEEERAREAQARKQAQATLGEALEDFEEQRRKEHEEFYPPEEDDDESSENYGGEGEIWTIDDQPVDEGSPYPGFAEFNTDAPPGFEQHFEPGPDGGYDDDEPLDPVPDPGVGSDAVSGDEAFAPPGPAPAPSVAEGAVGTVGPAVDVGDAVDCDVPLEGEVEAALPLSTSPAGSSAVGASPDGAVVEARAGSNGSGAAACGFANGAADPPEAAVRAVGLDRVYAGHSLLALEALAQGLTRRPGEVAASDREVLARAVSGTSLARDVLADPRGLGFSVSHLYSLMGEGQALEPGSYDEVRLRIDAWHARSQARFARLVEVFDDVARESEEAHG